MKNARAVHLAVAVIGVIAVLLGAIGIRTNNRQSGMVNRGNAISTELGDESVWLTDLSVACDAATKSKKPIFAYFTGSDWCVWCKKLDDEVLSKKEFQNFAATNVVLFKADFPRHKSTEQQQITRNEEIASKYHVSGFPTIILIDSREPLLHQLATGRVVLKNM